MPVNAHPSLDGQGHRFYGVTALDSLHQILLDLKLTSITAAAPTTSLQTHPALRIHPEVFLVISGAQAQHRSRNLGDCLAMPAEARNHKLRGQARAAADCSVPLRPQPPSPNLAGYFPQLEAQEIHKAAEGGYSGVLGAHLRRINLSHFLEGLQQLLEEDYCE